jgi:hypothetical protein
MWRPLYRILGVAATRSSARARNEPTAPLLLPYPIITRIYFALSLSCSTFFTIFCSSTMNARMMLWGQQREARATGTRRRRRQRRGLTAHAHTTRSATRHTRATRSARSLPTACTPSIAGGGSDKTQRLAARTRTCARTHARAAHTAQKAPPPPTTHAHSHARAHVPAASHARTTPSQ